MALPCGGIVSLDKSQHRLAGFEKPLSRCISTAREINTRILIRSRSMVQKKWGEGRGGERDYVMPILYVHTLRCGCCLEYPWLLTGRGGVVMQ